VNQTPVSPELAANYARERAAQIVPDAAAIDALGVRAILGDYLEEADGVARHATNRVALDLLRMAVARRQTASSMVQ
jgi:hypothetical protein